MWVSTISIAVLLGNRSPSVAAFGFGGMVRSQKPLMVRN